MDQYYTNDVKDIFYKDTRFEFIGFKGNDYRKKWVDIFTKDIDEETRNNIYMDQLLWHAISYRKIDSLIRNDAREKFKENFTGEWYVFLQYCDLVYKTIITDKIPVKFFDKFFDVYVVNKDFTKCYIHTHESSCGPYFVEI